MEKFRFLATGYKGLEDIHAKECEEIGIKVIAKEEGKILCEGTKEDVVKANMCLRTINKIYLLLLEHEVNSLDEIYEVAKSISYDKILDEKCTFAVKTSRVGEHNFTSLDINRVVGRAIIDSYRELTGKTLKVRLKHPDMQIRVYLVNNKLRIAVNVSGNSLHKRGYRKVKHIAPLKPTLAASLALLAELDKNSVVLDPFCGTGTVLIESAFRIRKIYPNLNKNFALNKMSLFRDVEIEKIRDSVDKEEKTDDIMFGNDINKKYVAGGVSSVKFLNLERFFFSVEDATKLNYKSSTVTHLISNPPYGIKMWNRAIGKTIIEFLNSLKSTDYKKVLISPNRKWREIISKDFEIVEQRKVFYGRFTNFITIFY